MSERIHVLFGNLAGSTIFLTCNCLYPNLQILYKILFLITLHMGIHNVGVEAVEAVESEDASDEEVEVVKAKEPAKEEEEALYQ